jgi:ubiquinone/menaquinone biosynthesis C-methylase UbiE
MSNPRPTRRGNLDPLGRYYTGDVAAGYEEFRRASKSWQAEDAAVRQIFDSIDLPSGAPILDVPVGTGRFIPFFSSRGYRLLGLDLSPEMVAAARAKASSCSSCNAEISTGDATSLNLPDKSVDAAVSVRFLVHLELPTVETVLTELARVSRRYVIAHVRVREIGFSASVNRWVRRAIGGWRRHSGSGETSGPEIKVADKLATIHSREALEDCWTRAGLQLVRDLTVNVTTRGYACHIFLFLVVT